jgi:stage II sporulation protein AA (anti-sigma F factor antagonist)
MPVILKNRNGTLTAYIKGEIDHHTVPDIRESIDDALVSLENVKILVLDFYDVSFMDSSGVGLVMGRYKLLKDTNAELHVTNTSPHIGKVMKIAGLERLAKFDKGEINNETK